MPEQFRNATSSEFTSLSGSAMTTSFARVDKIKRRMPVGRVWGGDVGESGPAGRARCLTPSDQAAEHSARLSLLHVTEFFSGRRPGEQGVARLSLIGYR
jgi:hypothetical protein